VAESLLSWPGSLTFSITHAAIRYGYLKRRGLQATVAALAGSDAAFVARTGVDAAAFSAHKRTFLRLHALAERLKS